MLIFPVKIVCRVAGFSFLAGIRRVALSSFAYCQNRFLSDFDRCVSCLVRCCKVFLFFVLIDVVKDALQPSFQLV